MITIQQRPTLFQSMTSISCGTLHPKAGPAIRVQPDWFSMAGRRCSIVERGTAGSRRKHSLPGRSALLGQGLSSSFSPCYYTGVNRHNELNA